MTADGKWLTLDETAEHLGCSRSMVNRLRTRGAVVCRRIGSLVQVSAESVAEFERRAVETARREP